MTKLSPEWVRTSDPVIRSPARYRWTTAPADLLYWRKYDAVRSYSKIKKNNVCTMYLYWLDHPVVWMYLAYSRWPLIRALYSWENISLSMYLNERLIAPVTLFPLLAALAMWLVNFMSLVNVTPRSFSSFCLFPSYPLGHLDSYYMRILGFSCRSACITWLHDVRNSFRVTTGSILLLRTMAKRHDILPLRSTETCWNCR